MPGAKTQMTSPTKLEIERAADRQAIADEENQKIQSAIEACGPGATAYGYYKLVDKLGIEPPRISWACRRPEHLGWQPKPPKELTTKRMTHEQHAGYEYQGGVFYPMRYSCYFGYLQDYKPHTAEQLAAARVKRVQKEIDEVERKRAESLFPQMFDEELQKLKDTRDGR